MSKNWDYFKVYVDIGNKCKFQGWPLRRILRDSYKLFDCLLFFIKRLLVFYPNNEQW